MWFYEIVLTLPLPVAAAKAVPTPPPKIFGIAIRWIGVGDTILFFSNPSTNSWIRPNWFHVYSSLELESEGAFLGDLKGWRDKDADDKSADCDDKHRANGSLRDVTAFFS